VSEAHKVQIRNLKAANTAVRADKRALEAELAELRQRLRAAEVERDRATAVMSESRLGALIVCVLAQAADEDVTFKQVAECRFDRETEQVLVKDPLSNNWIAVVQCEEAVNADDNPNQAAPVT
jgi:transcription elongation GreA/GreB family factor